MEMQFGFAASFSSFQTSHLQSMPARSVDSQANGSDPDAAPPTQTTAPKGSIMMMDFMNHAFLMVSQQMGMMSGSDMMTHPFGSGSEPSAAGNESMGGLTANAFAHPMMFSSVFMQFSLQVFGRVTLSAAEEHSGQLPAAVIEDPVLVADTAVPLAEQPSPVAESPVPVVEEPPVRKAPTPATSVADEVPAAAQPPATLISLAEPGSADPSPRPRLSIVEINTEDFTRYRMRQLSTEFETSLKLELKTRDGDVITLNFSQLDIVEATRFRGRTHDGDRVRLSSRYESTRRVVNIEVRGDLSDAETEAINKVLSAVIEAADQFFDGSLDKAMKQLLSMDFDTEELAEFSLQMNMTKSVEVTRSYQGGRRHLAHLAERDNGIMKLLKRFASEQHQLINLASEVLNPESAVRLVKTLLPTMLENPLAALMNHSGNQQKTADVHEMADIRDERADTDDDDDDDNKHHHHHH